MSAQVYSVPGQSDGKKGLFWSPFFEWKSIDLSYELSLTCVVNINYFKSVHHPIPIRENRNHRGSFQNKSISFAFN